MNAINFIPGSSNSFPSRELTNKQILRALDVERLRHHSHTLYRSTRSEALDIVRCYIRSKLPLILGVEVFSVDNQGQLTKLAGHAMTVVGADFSEENPCLYVHDDRLGPFARAEFVQINQGHTGYAIPDRTQQWGLVLQKKDDKRAWLPPHELLVPEMLFAMSDKKVDFSVDLVLNTCKLIKKTYRRGLDAIIPTKADSKDLALDLDDLRLLEIKAIKKDILKSAKSEEEVSPSDALTEAQRRRVAFLTQSFARYQWVATFNLGGEPAFTMLIDATDIPQGHAVSAIYVWDDTNFQGVMTAVGKKLENELESTAARSSFFASFLRRVRQARETLQLHLDKTYGEPRAPKRLKAAEVVNDEMIQNKDRRAFYEAVDQPLADLFPELVSDPKEKRIWVIDYEGTLIVGKEVEEHGHPTLTGFKPARVGGELGKDKDGWFINAKSGRYSDNYPNKNELLANALERFKAIFHRSREDIRATPYQEPAADPNPSS